MSAQPHSGAQAHSYTADDPETALKYAIQHIQGDRVQIIEGVPVTGFLRHRGTVTGVRTPEGDIEAEYVVAAVGMWGREFGALANAVDDPGYCDFYAPAVVSRGEFQIAISTGGSSPALSQHVRKQLEQDFGPEYESWTAWLGRMRDLMRKVLPRTESRKELLMLLALCKPAKFSNQQFAESQSLKTQSSKSQTTGGNHGPLEKIRTGNQVETRIERASA